MGIEVKIKYYNKDYPRLEKIAKGDWIDARVNSIRFLERDNIKNKDIDWSKDGEGREYLDYKKGDVIQFALGFAMEFPKGYTAYVLPRSSTYINYGFLLTNEMGIIDQSYCGDKDEWLVVYKCDKDARVYRYDRICQFAIEESPVECEFIEVEELKNKDRGGHGTTGNK